MDELIFKTTSAQEKNTISFYSKATSETLKLCENGDIFVKGKLIENDKEVVDAMREFLVGQGCLKEKSNE